MHVDDAMPKMPHKRCRDELQVTGEGNGIDVVGRKDAEYMIAVGEFAGRDDVRRHAEAIRAVKYAGVGTIRHHQLDRARYVSARDGAQNYFGIRAATGCKDGETHGSELGKQRCYAIPS